MQSAQDLRYREEPEECSEERNVIQDAKHGQADPGHLQRQEGWHRKSEAGGDDLSPADLLYDLAG